MTAAERVGLEESLLDIVNANPRIRLRNITLQTGLLCKIFWRILIDEACRPGQLMKGQHL